MLTDHELCFVQRRAVHNYIPGKLPREFLWLFCERGVWPPFGVCIGLKTSWFNPNSSGCDERLFVFPFFLGLFVAAEAALESAVFGESVYDTLFTCVGTRGGERDTGRDGERES